MDDEDKEWLIYAAASFVLALIFAAIALKLLNLI